MSNVCHINTVNSSSLTPISNESITVYIHNQSEGGAAYYAHDIFSKLSWAKSYIVTVKTQWAL